MKKRILSVLLIATLLISSLMTATVFASDDAHVEFLKSMGVIEEDFNPNAAMTRGEFVTLIMKLLYSDIDFDEVEKSGTPFADLETNHPYFSYIKAAKDIKIVNGGADSNFYPDREITPTEAVVMIINAYAYTYIANAGGGYPTGYLALANQLGMLKGVSFSDAPTGNMLLKIVYNSLFADVVSLQSVSDDGSINLTINDGVNMLTQRFNIVKFTGIVLDNGITSLEGTTLGYDDKVVLKADDGTKMLAYISDGEILNYLGSKVDAYIRYNDQTGRYEMMSFSVNDSSVELTIDARLITNVNFTGNYVEYQPAKDSLSVVKLNLETPLPKVTYNGTLISIYSADTFMPASGLVRFVDTDNNGKYDLVDILSFNYRELTDSDGDNAVDDPGMDSFGNIHHNNKTWNVVVDVVDTVNGNIICKENPAGNNIDIDEDNSIIRFTHSGDVKSVEDIMPGDIVSVAQAPKAVDGKKVYFLAVSRASVKGIVNAYTDKTITIDGVEYDVSKGILDSFMNLTVVNSENEYKLDVLGDIAYVVRATGVSKNYAYLINAKVTNSFEDKLYVKIFTKEGKIEYLYGAETMTIDGAKVSGASAQYAKMTVRYDDLNASTLEAKLTGDTAISRPIIYTVNSDNLITKIDTDTPNAITASPDAIYKDFTHIPYSSEEVDNYDTLKASVRYARSTTYKTATKTFDGRFYIDDNTVVMSVPDIDTYGLTTAMNNQGAGTVSAYSYTPEYAFVKEAEKDTAVISNYKVLTSATMSTSTYYDAQAYDVDPKTGVAGLVVLRGYDGYGYYQYTTSGTVYVFTKITTAYDIDREKEVKKIYYTTDGVNEETAYIDDDTLLNYMKLIVYGDTGANNPYGTAVTKLKAGDLIRLEKVNGYVTYIDRAVRMNETDLQASYGVFTYPYAPRSIYKQDTSYVTQPFDMNSQMRPQTTVSGFQLTKAISVSGNTLATYVPNEYYSGMDVNDITTYTVTYYNLTNVPITVVNVKTDGSIKVTKGSITDIKFDDSHSYLITRHNSIAVQQCFVLNFEQ